MGLPACAVLSRDTAIDDEEHFSHPCVMQCTAGANSPDLNSGAPKSISHLAPCSEGKCHHLHPPQPLEKALVTWARGTGE